MFAPGKAANAGGVAVSALEMQQNALRLTWTREEVDTRLKRDHARDPHRLPARPPRSTSVPGNYVAGANIAGFVKVADAVIDQGVV